MSVWQLRRIGDELDEIYMRYFAKDEVARMAALPDAAAAPVATAAPPRAAAARAAGGSWRPRSSPTVS